jgi:hypothetical protein
VTGAEAVQACTYTKLANRTQGDRPVYQLVGSTVEYLYYWPSTHNWFIGPNYTSDFVGVRSAGNAGAACPDQATGWELAIGGVGVGSYPITVVPTPPTTAAPTTVGKRFRCVRIRSA